MNRGPIQVFNPEFDVRGMAPGWSGASAHRFYSPSRRIMGALKD